MAFGIRIDEQLQTVGQVRQSFWNEHHFVRYPHKTQNDYPADVRMAFCDHVEYLSRSGRISETLAARVTLA